MNEEMEMDRKAVIPAGRVVALTLIALASSVLEAFLSDSALGIIFTVLTASFSSAALIFSGTFYPLLIGIGAYGVSFALSLDPVSSVASLEFIPVALVLAYSFKKKHPRLSMICRVSAVLLIFELAFFALAIKEAYGAFSKEVIRELAASLHEGISDIFFEALSMAMSENVQISYDAMSDMVTFIITLMPAIFISFYNIAAYLIQRTVIVIGRRVGAADMIYPEACIFKLSRMSALVFLFSYFAVVLLSGELTIFGVVTESLIVILTPGLSLLGVKDFIKRRKERSSAFPFFSVLGMAFLLFTAPVLFFGLSAFAGTWAALRRN